MTTNTLHFRPHHFLCALGFAGKGYSDPFVANFSQITAQLRAAGGDVIEIVVVDQTDSICTPCPHRRDTQCTEQTKIASLDQRHQAVLQIKAGDQLSWGEAKARIKQHMDLETFHKACEGCQWKALGVCEQALKQLLDNE